MHDADMIIEGMWVPGGSPDARARPIGRVGDV
jgi:hypothetical protein